MKNMENTNIDEQEVNSEPAIIYEGEVPNNFLPEPQESKELDEEKVEAKKVRKWQKKQEVYNKNHALAQENEQLKAYLYHMQDLLNKSVDQGSYHYEEQVKGELEKAQDKFAKAAEEGDAKMAAVATTEIARIQADMADYERKKRNMGRAEQNTSVIDDKEVSTTIDPEAGVRVQNAYEWIKDNPELKKGSKRYDENLNKQVVPFIKKLEDKLYTTNQKHLIASDLYFEIIDQYIDSIKNLKTKTNGYNGSTSSRYASNSVGVGYIPELTKEQKRAAAAFGMSEKEYMQSFKKHEKEYINER